jgi:hypothetical protein
MGAEVSEWLRMIGSAIGVVTAIWVLAKDKMAAELAPKLALHFQTRDAADKTAEEHRKDHRVLEAQIGSVAEHKALIAVRPLELRLESFEKELSNLSGRLDESRAESRQDFKRVFERLDAISQDISRLSPH